MHDAHNLFEYGAEVKTLCHKNDPETSREAAVKMVESGKLSRQEGEVLFEIEWDSAIYKMTDFTAKEIAHKWSLIQGDYAALFHKIQRRLSGLYRKGKIERTGEKREGCCVWRLIKER